MRNVATLQFGSFWGYLIQAVAAVFIARLLQPQRFGIYSLAMGLASLVFVSTGLQETITVVLGETYTKKDWSATREALAFFVKFTAIFSAISLAIIFILPALANAVYHNSAIGFYAAMVVAASIVSSSLFSISSMILQVTNRIKAMTLLVLSDQTVRFGIALTLTAAGLGVLGATSGHLIGAIVIFLISALIWERVRRTGHFPSLRSLALDIKRASLKKYAGFSIRVALDKNIAGLYAILPVLLTGIYLSSEQVSFFKLSFGYVNLAMTLMIPISTLLNFEIPKMRILEPRHVRRNFIRISLYATAFSTLLVLGAVITAPVVFRFLYGASFAPAISYVIGFFVYGALYGIGIGLGSMWRALDKVSVSIIINLAVLAVGIPTGLVLIKHLGVWGTIISVTAWYVISHLISFLYLAKKLGTSWQTTS